MKKQKEMSDHQVLPYCVLDYLYEAWCVRWSECVMAFSTAFQLHMMVQYCCDSGSKCKLFCMCFML